MVSVLVRMLRLVKKADGLKSHLSIISSDPIKMAETAPTTATAGAGITALAAGRTGKMPC